MMIAPTEVRAASAARAHCRTTTAPGTAQGPLDRPRVAGSVYTEDPEGRMVGVRELSDRRRDVRDLKED